MICGCKNLSDESKMRGSKRSDDMTKGILILFSGE